jgi:hypothetical protein
MWVGDRSDRRNEVYLAASERGATIRDRSDPTDDARPNSEGRSFDLAFAENGRAVIAGNLAFAISDGAPIDGTPPSTVFVNTTINATD